MLREAGGRIERSLIRDMGELRLIGSDLPGEFGAGGLDSVTAGLIIEELSRGDINVGYVPLLGSLMGSIIAAHARPEVSGEIIPKICSGQVVVALGLTEPHASSDAAHLRAKARAEGSEYVLWGEKTSISMIEQADYILVLARTSQVDLGAGGVSALLTPLDVPGITRSCFDDVGSKAVGRGSVFFDVVRVPGLNLVGAEGGGFRQVMQGLDYSRALIGLQCLAPALASLEETWKYVTDRSAFATRLPSIRG